MNVNSVNRFFQAFSNDRLGNATVNMCIEIGSSKSPVTIPVQNILLEKGVILIKGEIPNMDVLNKSEETKISVEEKIDLPSFEVKDDT
jgi:hypothetical protein